MAAAASPCGGTGDQKSIADPPTLIQHAYALLATPVSNLPPHSASPASTESLLSRTMADILHIPMLQSPFSHTGFQQAYPQLSANQNDMVQLQNCFSDMLRAGLAQNASQITSSIKADLQSLVARIDVIEQAVDNTAARTNQNTTCIQTLQDQLEITLAKPENRSRR